MAAAVNWSVEILEWGSGAYLFSPEICQPLRLEWSDQSGPERALIACPNRQMTLMDWTRFLGHDLRVYDQQGRLAWWGFLESVSQRSGGKLYELDLAAVANRVAVRYQESDDPRAGTRLSAWHDHLLSQERFGIKEKILWRRFLSPAAAEAIAQAKVEELAFPQTCLKQADRDFGKESESLVLNCRGWIQTLDWRIWNGWSGVVEHRPAQLGVQLLGSQAADGRAAQSFILPAAMEAFSASIRARKQGSPTDGLRVSLQTNLNGKPSGIVLASQSVPASQIDEQAYQWLDLNLTPNVSLGANTRYWLVVERLGAYDPLNAYWLGVDENLGFNDGICLIHNGSDWQRRSPEADLLFRFVGKKDFRLQLAEVLQYGSPFLNGVDTSQLESASLPVFAGKGATCLESFYDLLEQGDASPGGLRVSVSPGRRVELAPLAMVKDALYYLENDGTISNRFGQKLTAPWQAVGEWLHTNASQPIYVRAIALEPQNDRLSINGSVRVYENSYGITNARI